ncbi:MAG TPA: hypothetical protein VHJ76_06035 [Actinomycetota bacterium]|nr:hypothetical protein [Actinomycetota bacterium]
MAFVCLAVLAGACADDGGTVAGEATPAADFRSEVAELCAPVTDREERLLDGDSLAELREASAELTQAELDLAADLRALEAPTDVSDEVDAYADVLERYAEAIARSVDDRAGSRAYGPIVKAARLSARLDEAAAAADLPVECPPLAGFDAGNTLFVAKANRECSELRDDLLSAGRIERPRTAEEIALVLDLGQRVSAGIARAVERSAPDGALEIEVKRIIRANKKRFLALAAVEQSFRDGDFGAYNKATRKLVRVSATADRKMLSLGLVACARVFGLIPL